MRRPGGGQVKSQTDLYWSQRATSVEGDAEVNIMDIFQRDLEYDHVCSYLEKEMSVLEVGCGNGFSTTRFRGLVKHIDAFDSSEEMIRRARATYGESNNTFIHDSVLAPRHLSTGYDAILCIRVLINLRHLSEQRLAIRNLVPLMRIGGRFILVEGFSDGFSSLNELRSRVGLAPLEPAAINFYSSVDEVVGDLGRELLTEAEFHLGAYDYLTRVVYPLMAGPEGVKHNSVFSEKCAALARGKNPDCFKDLSRVRGFVFKRVA
jgi:SAM-dependent methyltransferase